MKIKIILLATILLTGCATLGGSDMSAMRDGWNGASFDEVVTRWGAATRNTTLADGREVYTWDSTSTRTSTSVFPSIGISGGTGGLGIGIGTGISLGGGIPKAVHCERTVTFKNKIVVEQSWLGAAEYCNSFKRKD